MSETDQPTALAAAIKLPDPTTGAPGIFDNLEALKISLNEAGLAGATEVLVRVPVRKPARQEYFRVRPGEDNSFTTVLYEDRETREHYFIAPAMIPFLRSYADLAVATLVPFITKQRVVGIFPLKLAMDATVQSGWQSTAMAAAQTAKSKWVRMQADMGLGGYRIFTAEGKLGEPSWPETPFNELLNIAFTERVIASEDHPMVNKILGRL